MSCEARYRYLNESRPPRRVSGDMRDRCVIALTKEGLSETEKGALLVLVTSHAMEVPVSKRELDRAAGVLGRVEANRR